MQEPDFDPDTTAPVLRYQINYTENAEVVNVIDLYPEDYNSRGGFTVDFTITDLKKNTRYDVTIIAFNIRGPGAIFRAQTIVTPPCRESHILL